MTSTSADRRDLASGAGTFASPGGYLDDAIPQNQLRLRFDAAYGDNRPDRADFFYPKCGCFATLPPTSPLYDPNAKGPPLPEKSVDYQEYKAYLETAVSNRLSGFVEVPVVSINPEVNADHTGLGDVNFGFKYALIADPCKYLTLQFRTYAPSGDPSEGLGTNNWAVEPALLYRQSISDRLTFQGQFQGTIPIASDDNFAGDVLMYGAGLAYRLTDGPIAVTPVAELVGWTVLNGMEFDANSGVVKSAGGDTIVNAKIGARTYFGDRNDLYIGYGHVLTGARWYEDIVRVEYRLRF